MQLGSTCTMVITCVLLAACNKCGAQFAKNVSKTEQSSGQPFTNDFACACGATAIHTPSCRLICS